MYMMMSSCKLSLTDDTQGEYDFLGRSWPNSILPQQVWKQENIGYVGYVITHYIG